MAACFNPSDKTIYVAAEGLKLSKWVPVENLKFDLRHELGHAINAKFDSLGEPISESAAFREAFKRDMKRLDPEILTELKIPTVSPYATRDEIFSDLYAHATGLQTTSYRSNQVRVLFRDCLKYIAERKDLP